MYPYNRKFKMYFWIVYDKSPPGSLPTTATIFDTLYPNQPNTWTVGREVCHRFVVKKKWTVGLSSNGTDPTKAVAQGYTGPGPCEQFKTCNKFFKRLGVSTEWKNSVGGDIGDIKQGAMYLVGAPEGGGVINVHARFRVYFKSVGNQ